MNFIAALDECHKGKVMRLNKGPWLIRILDAQLYACQEGEIWRLLQGAIPVEWFVGKWYERHEVTP